MTNNLLKDLGVVGEVDVPGDTASVAVAIYFEHKEDERACCRLRGCQWLSTGKRERSRVGGRRASRKQGRDKGSM